MIHFRGNAVFTGGEEKHFSRIEIKEDPASTYSSTTAFPMSYYVLNPTVVIPIILAVVDPIIVVVSGVLIVILTSFIVITFIRIVYAVITFSIILLDRGHHRREMCHRGTGRLLNKVKDFNPHYRPFELYPTHGAPHRCTSNVAAPRGTDRLVMKFDPTVRVKCPS